MKETNETFNSKSHTNAYVVKYSIGAVCLCVWTAAKQRTYEKYRREDKKKNQQRKTGKWAHRFMYAIARDHLMHHLTIPHYLLFFLLVRDVSAALRAICSITITIHIRGSFPFTHSHVSLSPSVSVPFSMSVISTQISVFFSIFGHKLTSILYTHTHT